MKFAVPRIWHEPSDHSSNCYFCVVDPSKRRAGKNASAIIYPDLPSSIAPMEHSAEFPVPTPPERKQPPLKEVEEVDSEFSGFTGERKPYYPNQRDLDDLISDLGLTKSKAELLTSRLTEWQLLDESLLVKSRKRQRHF